MSNIPNIPEWLKLSPKYLLPVVIVSGVLVFGGDSLLDKLGMKIWQQANRQWIGGAFLLSSALCLSNFGATVFGWLRVSFQRQALMRRWRQRLQALTPDEQELLRFFIINQTRTQKLNVMDGVVGGLEAAKIIYKSATVGTVFDGWDYNLQPWAWDYLNEHPQLVGL